MAIPWRLWSRERDARVYASAARPTPKREPWYEFTAQADDDPEIAELKIFGPIGGGFFVDEDAVTGRRVAEQLDELPDSVKTVRVLVNSPGGSVFDAIHIANALRRQRDEIGRNVEVDIEALAASAATIVTSAGDPIRMPRNALMMVHNPRAVGIGDANLMRELADVLDKVRNTIVATYRWVSKLSKKKIQDLMDATTWMEADEAIENGFATEISKPVEASASLTPQALAYLEAASIPEEMVDRVHALAEGEHEHEIQEEAEGGGSATPDPDGEDTEEGAGGAPPEPPDDDVSEQEGASASAEPSEETMTKEQQEAAKKAERDRILGIQKAAQVAIGAGLDKEKAEEIQSKAVEERTSLDKAREQIFDALAEISDNIGPGANSQRIVPGEDEHDKRSRGIEAALLARSPNVVAAIRAAHEKYPDHPAFQDLDVDGGEFRGLTLVEHLKADLERMDPGASRGITTRNVVPRFAAAASNYQTTSDFSTGLENTMHKTLLASYAIAPDTWRQICAVGEVSDFRAHPRYRTGYIASLDQIYEDGEFTSKTLPDAAKEAITALTYGNIVGLSRQAIINDDMGMFSRVAMQVGRAAALTIEAGFYSLLGQNSGLGPAMNDGNPLFDASHSNLGAGAALSAAAVDADAAIMEAQQDPNTQEYLQVRPSRLLVPRGLRATAITINESRFDPDTADSNKPNTVLGLFDLIVATPRLSGTRRYMFADPAILPCIEVAFLNGEQDPYVEMRDGWTTDGVDWKVRHDFGIAAIEYRAGLTDGGA